jgi:hypothetical protein
MSIDISFTMSLESTALGCPVIEIPLSENGLQSSSHSSLHVDLARSTGDESEHIDCTMALAKLVSEEPKLVVV